MKRNLPAIWMTIHFNSYFKSNKQFLSQLLSFTRLALFLLSFFTFLMPGVSSAQQWQVLANETQIASFPSGYTHIATTIDGAVTIPYVVYTESGIAKVKKYDGDNWIAVGGNVSDNNVTYTRIYIDDNSKIYVTYVDVTNGNRLAVKSFDETTQTWEPLNGDANNLYVSAGSVTNSISQYSSTQRSALAFTSNNIPYLIYGEGTALNPYVKQFTGTAWEPVGGTMVSSQRAIGVGIAIDNNDVPFIVYINQATATSTTGNIIVYRYLDNNWEQIPVTNPVTGGSATSGATTVVRHTNIRFNSDWNPVVSYFNASNSNRATVIVYNKLSGIWNLSGVISGRDITHNSLTRDQLGNLYASFVDVISSGSGRSVARVMKLATGSTSWTEAKNADVVQGIDEPAGNLSLAVGADSRPYVIYTKPNSSSVVTPVVQVLANVTPPPPPPPPPADEVVNTPKQVEKLNRGVVAIRSNPNEVYIGWRLFGTDPADISFNVYRDATKLNATPITNFC